MAYNKISDYSTLDYLANCIMANRATNTALDRQPTEVSSNINMPEFFNDIGKTLNALKNENPQAQIFVPPYPHGLPDAAIVCFGEPNSKYAYYFFGAQAGDAEYAINELSDYLKCAGFETTANTLFPEMDTDMSFSDFFSLIDVSDYEYFAGEDTGGQGWLLFTYNNMVVWLNANDITNNGWDFTDAETIKRSAPVIIYDDIIDTHNFTLVDAVMFEM